jgi:NADPH-dependent 7-cyano-7-deazaguanine reductase QueF-like protein
MTITERNSGDVTILDVEGKILLGEGDVQLKRKIDELIESKKTKLVLNLANVPYMDRPGRNRAQLYDGQTRGRRIEAAQRHQTDQ